MSRSASFYFHDSLNDFLLPSKKNTRLLYRFNDIPAIKHAIEALGVPHPEVGRIVVHGKSVDPFYRLQDNDQVEVYAADSVNFLSDPEPNSYYDKFILDVN